MFKPKELCVENHLLLKINKHSFKLTLLIKYKNKYKNKNNSSFLFERNIHSGKIDV